MGNAISHYSYAVIKVRLLGFIIVTSNYFKFANLDFILTYMSNNTQIKETISTSAVNKCD